MKYKIIVADDEPTASQFICALIEKRTNDFEIVATAENGQVCLNLVEAYQPDVVITDIKMPVMDGIELIRQLNIDHPTVLTILISGYEEFQYARAALKYNAVDYIKKPVTPRIFSETMASVKTRLDQMFYEERNHAIRNLSKGIPVGERLLQKYFPDGPYYAVLMRRNGLPRRFSGNKAVEVFSEAYESIIVYGRDEMESLYLIANSLLVGFEETMTLDQYIRKLLTQERTAAYATVISSREPIEFSRFGEKIQRLYQTLDLKTVIGKNQILFLEECFESPSKAWSSVQQFQKLEYYMAQHQREKIKSELRALFDEWEQQSLPQIQVEELVNHIIYLFRSHGEGIDMDCSIDFQLEDAFSTAPNMTILEETIETILFENCGDKITPGCGKIDTPEFFDIIRRTVRNRLNEQLSLQSIAKEFAISPAYISKLFRKYENTSFNNYLTSARIERARELMDHDQNLFVKDIAAMGGYSDQFYFSRLFRSYVGICPTEYLNSKPGDRSRA